jgi:hypothetical protein
LSVSLAPRQEIRGGFPKLPEISATPAALAPHPLREPGRAVFSLPMPQARVLTQASPTVKGIGRSPPTTPPSSVASSSSPSQSAPSLIEQLIEQTTVPGTLPGLELRLVNPESVRAHPSESRDRTEEKTPSPPAASTPFRPAPAAPLPPPLDINAVADQVYQKLQHCQRFERERRGWC